MTRLRSLAYLAPAAMLAGLILVTVFSPRASRADEYDTPRTHQLWVCRPEMPCAPLGLPKNSTACALDLAAVANTMPKGTRLDCKRVTKS